MTDTAQPPRSDNAPDVRIAIFDVGHWHFPLYLPAFDAPGMKVIGVSDSGNFAGARMAERLGCDLTSRDELMSREFDFALVLSRHANMAAVAQALVARGTPFLIEKPCGLSSHEVRALRDAAEAAGVFVAVPFIMRVSALMDELTQHGSLSPSGYRHLSFHFIVGPISRYERSGNAWMLSAAQAGGGSAMNVGVHFYDLVAALTQSDIVSVSGATRHFRDDVDVEELAAFTLTTRSGLIATVTTGYLYPNTPDDQRAFGFVAAHEDVALQGYADRIAIKRPGDPTLETVLADYETDSFYPTFLADTLDRLRTGRPPVAGLSEALQAISVVEAGYRSARNGGSAEAVV